MRVTSWNEDYFGAEPPTIKEQRFIVELFNGHEWDEWAADIESYIEALREAEILKEHGFEYRIKNEEGVLL